MSNFPRKQGCQPENTNALRHGAYSYLAAKADGRAIAAEARAIEVEVENELAEKGPGWKAEREAVKQFTAATMLWRYMLTSEENFWKGLRPWVTLTNSGVRNLEKAAALDNAHAKDVIADYEELIGESE
jgi:hypothetical protein